jgi:hypothetical protein
MDDQELRAAIRELTAESKAPCKALLDLAARSGRPPAEIGRLCNEMDIKVRACQLGCFP